MEVFLGIFLTLVIFQSIILVIRKRQRKAVDAAYKRGLEDAKQASKEVIKDIKIKVSEGKPFHVAANEIANEMKRLLDERKGVI